MPIKASCLILALASVVSTQSLRAQYGVGNVGGGKATAAVIGIAVVGAAAGVGVTYLVLHHRGVTTGCVSASDGKQIFTTGSKQSFTLANTGPALTSGERYKLKGRISGSSPARTFTVDKTLKDVGACSEGSGA